MPLPDSAQTPCAWLQWYESPELDSTEGYIAEPFALKLSAMCT